MEAESTARAEPRSNGGSHPVMQQQSTGRDNPAPALESSSSRAVAYWLFFCCVMIYMMVVIGGVTRLTRSGLSMVEWKPILGAIPPISQASWEAAFNKYKAYPEYKVRRDMTLSGFKQIYLVEYFHRLFGRLIGLVFFLPFVFFWLRGRLRKTWILPLIGLFVLGGLQGLLGWYMVKSGLINVPRVSPYRLTAHLGLAVFLYGATLWLALRLSGWRGKSVEAGPTSHKALHSLQRWTWLVLAMISVMILSGGFVAGNRAGFGFNTFPLMNGALIPSGLLNLSPWYINFFENNLTVQFQHRMIAYLLCVLIPWLWWLGRKAGISGALGWAFHSLLAALALQVTLGIVTLLWVVPIPMAAAHQAGALLLLTSALVVLYLLSKAAMTEQEAIS